VTLSQERTGAEYRSTLLSVQEEVQRLAQLTSALLLLARTDAHELPLTLAAVNPGLLLNTIAEQFGSLAAEKNIRLECETFPDLTIRGDEDRLIQVIFNLMDNALKYTPAGGRVRIAMTHDQQRVKLMIEDSGPGIPIPEQGQIFERFYRVDHARSRSQGGLGLGLAIARRIVDLHKGTIQVISEPGCGARFIVTLPLR
ncbi:MAG: hypothetical protein H7X77_09010, partial [Anaerolineae bacterium]|nr:hypothetical protein [Anaerolineae bacterium]